jgi:hypothetical protein
MLKSILCSVVSNATQLAVEEWNKLIDYIHAPRTSLRIYMHMEDLFIGALMLGRNMITFFLSLYNFSLYD